MIRSMDVAWWVNGGAEPHPQKTALIFETDCVKGKAADMRESSLTNTINMMGGQDVR
jgi:hypothetical protein